MSNWRILYWLLVGAFFGVGVVAILSIGVFLLAAGVALLIVGAARFGGKGLWAGIVGFGAAPALLLLWDVTSQPWACMGADQGTTSPIMHGGVYRSPNYFECVPTVFGQLTTYHVLAAAFGAIALFGLLVGLVVFFWGRSHPRGGLGAA